MGVMDKLKVFVVQEPVVAASCLLAGVGKIDPSLPFVFFLKADYPVDVYMSDCYNQLTMSYALNSKQNIIVFGLFLPAVVRPILDSFESSKQVPQPALTDVVAGMTGKKHG
ncbi:hypothetical protein DM860_004690 [Cuscuta australis]|uniref:Uncharacterized protein n=1 Tax=Cuscuta australis TaxID=267555 RepID=A0A328ECA5_9ASTE|nr:hypothetical protein DM860_004690 [Cuscuta australis]